MSEEQTSQDSEQTSASESTADATAADSRTDSQQDTSGQADQSASGESSKANESDKGNADSATAGSSDKDQSQGKGSQDSPQPKFRRSQNRFKDLADENRATKEENARLRARLAGNGQQNGQDSSDDQSNQSTTDPETKARLDRVEQGTKLVLEQAKASEDAAELAEFFTGDLAPERQAYESQIRKMWEQPQYRDLSVADAFAILDHSKAAQRAVETFKKAQKEAKDSSTGGNNSSANRTGSGTGLLPPDDVILANNEKVKAGQAT